VVDCFDTIVGIGTGSLVSRYPNGAMNPYLPHCSNCDLIEFRFTDNGLAKTGNTLQSQPYDYGEFTVSDTKVGFGILASCMDCPYAKAAYLARQRSTFF
jgi:hypothetical protein